MFLVRDVVGHFDTPMPIDTLLNYWHMDDSCYGMPQRFGPQTFMYELLRIWYLSKEGLDECRSL